MFSPCWRVSVNNNKRVTWATQASQDLFSFSTLIYSRCARCITEIPEDNENCQKMCRRRRDSSYPSFLVPHQTSVKSEEKSHGNVFLASFLPCVLKYGKTQPADEFNAVSYERQNLCVFYVLYFFVVEWCMIISFFTEKGCKHIKHDDELLWIQLHTVKLLMFDCMIFLFYLLCFLISSREWEAYVMWTDLEYR